VQLSIH